MRACPTCRAENAEDAKFCAECGTKLPAPVSTREVRKTVSVLFADVVGSTELGERLDPESVRALMTRYFAIARSVIERHGGTVEKFIGDAVMAVFGVPLVHEDDALRAVRAGAELRVAIRDLGAGLEIRVGVNTGEVIAGDATAAQTFVTGDAVNVAARLQAAGGAGDILLGPATVALVRDAVELGPSEPLTLKGKSQPIEARRLIEVSGSEGRHRRPDAPLIGRETELDTLEATWRTVTIERNPELVTLVALAGVGKSRLIAEFVERSRADGLVLVGRCLSYGEGITYWPVRELVHAAAGITERDEPDGAQAKIGALLAGERDADILGRRVASAVGLSTESAPQEELFWAIRRLLETLARRRPLVVVLEDLHWAEPTLLDLVEYIVDLATDVPLLLLGTARPELLESRPGWGSGRPDTILLRLEPLGTAPVDALVDQLPGGAAIPGALRSRILDAAEGTPLYVEEFVGLLRDGGHLVQAADGRWQAQGDLAELPVPPTVQALLAARLDRLPALERTVAERGSVAGRSFESAMLGELDPQLSRDLGRGLLALVRKELLRPDRAELTAGDAFRFRHILIRDAAYGALPKSDRAGLHERFADWLERVAGERIAEYEEILGYHLAEAHRYRLELGEAGEDVERLGARAAQRLSNAGLRAFDRSDAAAAADLLGRADQLDPINPTALLALAEVRRRVGRLEAAIDAAARAAILATETNQPDLARRAQMRVLDIVSFREPSALRDLRVVAAEALASAGTTGDPTLIAEAWRHLSMVAGGTGKWEESLQAAEKGLAAATVGGDRRIAAGLSNQIVIASLMGPTRCPDAIARCEAFLGAPVTLESRAWTLSALACLRAMSVEESSWEALLAESDELYGQMGDEIHQAICRELAGSTYLRLGDVAGAERKLRQAFETLQRIGDTFILVSVAGCLAQVLVGQGRLREAEPIIEIGLAADRDDTDAQVQVRIATARLRAARSDPTGAEAIAGEAEALVETTDEILVQADVACLMADILTLHEPPKQPRGRSAGSPCTNRRARKS